jgi:hypothetical protein
MKTPLILFSLLMISCLAAVPGIAQTSNVYGKVMDKQTQKPLYGVNVSLEDDQLGIGTITNENGEFRLWNLPGDTINVLIRCDGYQTYVLEISSSSNSSPDVKEIYLEAETDQDHKQTSFRLFPGKKENHK